MRFVIYIVIYTFDICNVKRMYVAVNLFFTTDKIRSLKLNSFKLYKRVILFRRTDIELWSFFIIDEFFVSVLVNLIKYIYLTFNKLKCVF